MADTPKVVSTAAPRYIHGIQSNVNASDAWLTPRIQENEQATLMDSYTDYGTTTVEGDLYVMSSSDGPTHHNSLNGRADPDSHPISAIGGATPTRVIFGGASGQLAESASFTFDAAGDMTCARPVRFTDTTASTSTSTGALVVSGGIASGGDIRNTGDVRSNGNIFASAGASVIGQALSTISSTIRTVNAGGTIYIGVDSSTGGSFGAGAYGSFIYSEINSPMSFWTNSSQRVRIEAAGEVKILSTTASTATTNGSFVVSGGVGCGDYFTGKYRSSDGTAGLTATRTFYAASSSGGAVNVLNTVTIKDGIITSWTQA